VAKNKSSQLSDTLTNTGTSPVTISAASVSGAGFSLSAPVMPMTLAANQSVTLTVTFAPTGAGSASGTLSVTSTAADSSLSITLTGAETPQGQLAVTPGTLQFGNVLVGASASVTGSVKANQNPVTISGAGSSSGEFVLSGISLPMTLNAGQSASFSVAFTPASSGSTSATLSFMSDATDSPASSTLVGTGQAPAQHDVDLSWNASSSSDVIGYNVYRGSASGGPYSQINSALEASTAYADSSVTSGSTYYYVTTAVAQDGSESIYSNEVGAAIPTP